uniref:Uncharacterized protein n=1 Tax=Setaria italica TaxID=4555 RepID=K3XUB9_SETIT
MDLENRIVGVTFFYKETTPLLPVEIATRCLKSFRKHKYAIFFVTFVSSACIL